MIRTRNLTKNYGQTVAVKDLSIHVKKGEIYGFLGPNGAGKTTTISMILGVIKPTSGSITIFDKTLHESYFEIKRKIGVVSEHQSFYDNMTAYEYLSFFGDLFRLDRIGHRVDEMLHRVDLYHRKNQRLGSFSKGMKQRVSLCRALLNDPELLILDEPITSLDPYGILEFRDLICEENRKGKTILMSSHVLSEVERMCDRVGIMDKGRLVVEDSMDNLRKRLTSEVEIELELDEPNTEIETGLRNLEFVNSVSVSGNSIVVRVKSDLDCRKAISQLIYAQGGIVLSMNQKEMNLEDAFVTITEHSVSLLAQERETL